MTTPWVRAVWRGAWPSPAEQSPPAPPPGASVWALGLWLCHLLLLWSLFQFLGVGSGTSWSWENLASSSFEESCSSCNSSY